jgi:hypothetical protein
MPHLPVRNPISPVRLRRHLGGLAAMLLVLLTLACSGSSRGNPAGALEVVNNGTANMIGLNVVPSSYQGGWGPDQLYPLVLGYRDSLTLAPMAPDSYDVRAVSPPSPLDPGAGNVMDVVRQVPVLDGETYSLPMTNVGTVEVVNDDPTFYITEIYLVPSVATHWGLDQALSPLYPHQTLDLVDVIGGTYDLRVVFSDMSYVQELQFPVVPGTIHTFRAN